MVFTALFVRTDTAYRSGSTELPKYIDVIDVLSNKMTREKEIKQLDQMLREALDLCASSGMSAQEIKTAAKPVLVFQEKWKNRERIWSLFFLSLVVVVGAVLYQSEIAIEFISAVAKIGMVKYVLPYWDWTGLHARDCLFENPYEATDEITKEQCEPLSSLTTVDRMLGMSQDEMTEDHLYTAVPVIITDATKEWKAITTHNFDMKFISKLYHEDPVLSNTSICWFSGIEATLQDFLEKMDTLEQFQVHWGHCKIQAAKVLRTFYQRPYFLPGMVEADAKNFLVMGRRKDPDRPPEYRAFPNANMQMTWFSQITGQFSFKLSPCDICSETCPILEGTLREGESLVYCNEFWQLQYSPVGEEEAIAISSGGSWSD